MVSLYYPISGLINALLSLVLGILVIKKSRDKLNVNFFLLNISIFVWSFFYFFWLISDNAQEALFFVKMFMVGAIFVPYYYLKVIAILVGRKTNTIFYRIFFTFLLLCEFSLLSNLFVSHVEQKLQFPYWPEPGIWGVIYILLIVVVMYFYATYLVFDGLKNSKGVERAKLRIILLSFTFAFFSGITNYLLWFDIPIPPIANILVSVYVLMTGYAILRYRFLDIRVVIKRSLIFTVLVLLITSVFSATAFFLSSFVQSFFGQNSILVSGAITGIIVAIGFEPIKGWLTRATDSFLFKGQVDPQIALSEASGKISSTLDIRKLGKVVADTAYKVLKYSKFKVYIFDQGTNSFMLAHKEGQGGSQDVALDNPLYAYYENYEKDLEEKTIVVLDELRFIAEQADDEFLDNVVAYLEQHNLNVVAPLYIKGDPLGYVLIGEKKSGDPYTNEDLNFIKVLAGQAAVAFENAKLYEEQLRFADKLQDEVNKATKELRAANKELKKLDQAKSEFISIASHQLRTPMTAIKGYMSMVQSGDFGQVPEKLDKPVNSVLQSADRLLILIEDLLNISRIESGRMQYEFEKANLRELVESVFDELGNHAKMKKLEFVYLPPKDEIPDVIMDKLKVREVVMNLADNAIKYTDEGKVELSLERKGNDIIYRVRDTGRGLSKEDKGKLFKKFSRVGSSQLVHTEGTGLGLYIAKQIIKRHKGKLWADSQGPGKGSVFALSLKIENPDLEKDMEQQQAALQAVREERAAESADDENRADTIDMSKIKKRKPSGT